MKKNRGATIGIGILFGFIAFAVTVFFFTSPQLTLAFGVFTPYGCNLYFGSQYCDGY